MSTVRKGNCLRKSSPCRNRRVIAGSPTWRQSRFTHGQSNLGNPIAIDFCGAANIQNCSISDAAVSDASASRTRTAPEMAGVRGRVSIATRTAMGDVNGNTDSIPDVIFRLTYEPSNYRDANNSGRANAACGFPRLRR